MVFKKRFLHISSSIGEAVIIFFDSFLLVRNLYKRRERFFTEIKLAGINTLFLVSIVALFTGMILSLQSGITLQQWGQEERIGQFVVLTLFREMGPFMTALIIAASVGSAYAAEIATMKISEEISALKVMGINHLDLIIMPKLFALIVVLPTLIIYTNTLGIIGAMIIASSQLNVSPDIFITYATEGLKSKDLVMGFFKGVIFAIIILTICSYKGLKATNGAKGVSKSTRSTVITSFIAILISGYVITKIFYG